MVGTREGILGLRPEAEGLVIDPSIPSSWKGFSMIKNFRGKRLFITVENPGGSQHGVREIIVNEKTIEGTLIPESILKEENDVVVRL